MNFKIEKKIYQYFGCSDAKDREAYNNSSAFVTSYPACNIIAFKDKKAFMVNSIEEKEDLFGTSLVVSYTEDYSRIPYDSAPSYSECPYTIVFYKNGKMVYFKDIFPALTTTDGKNTSFHYKNTGYGFCRIRCFKLNILLYFAVKILLCYLQLFL